jgi:putative transcriptional regulator
MVEILRSKSYATKFQILLEIASGGPNIQQKAIASRLGITQQAVSEYIGQLEKDGLIVSGGRSRHRITNEGVNWVLKILRELRNYIDTVTRVINNVVVSAVIAADDITRGQKVILKMKEGLMYATGKTESGARGIAVSDAKKGEDVAISSVEGLVGLKKGEVRIIKVPNVQKGGARKADLKLLKKELKGRKEIGAIGIEALVCLKQIGIEPRYFYGVTAATIDASRHGLNVAIVCTDDELPALLIKFDEQNVTRSTIDISL